MSTAPILYLGDTALMSAASYLAGLITRLGHAFDYVPTGTSVTAAQLQGRKLIVLSDYPARCVDEQAMQALLTAHASGTGLLCLGGWESFTGWHAQEGGWQNTPVAELLPIELSTQDDRINFDQMALVIPADGAEEHAILADLPWDDRPPVVGGWNKFKARDDAQVLLDVRVHGVRWFNGEPACDPLWSDPMLVVKQSTSGSGRIACLATDAAPHWVGPMVDWGTCNLKAPSGSGRISAEAPGGEGVEVGQYYAKFFSQLLTWTMA